MDDRERQELADRAGVDRAIVDRMIELGLIREAPQPSIANVRRVRVVDGLDRSGMPLDLFAAAVDRGELSLDFVDQPAYDRFAAMSDVTFRDLHERTGLPMDILCAIREAMGFAQPGPDDRVRETELEVVPLLETEFAAGITPATMERSLRTYGESMRRVAESQADWWRADILMPLVQAGLSGAEIGRRTEAFANETGSRDDAAILAIFHGRQSIAWMRNIFEGFESVLERSGSYARQDRPAAICFLDLTGYTRLTDERGDEAAVALASRLSRLVQRTSAEHGGRPVKYLGDGVMFHFPDPGLGVLAALDMIDGAAQADLPPAHVGLDAGSVIAQEGDYFGRTVNTAARIADYARQGEVLVSQAVVDAAMVVGVRFEPIGAVELKGLMEAVPLHVARRGAP